MPALFIRQQFVISQVVVMERGKCDEVVEKLESMENSCKMWLLNALQHSPIGRFPWIQSILWDKIQSSHRSCLVWKHRFRGPRLHNLSSEVMTRNDAKNSSKEGKLLIPPKLWSQAIILSVDYIIELFICEFNLVFNKLELLWSAGVNVN